MPVTIRYRFHPHYGCELEVLSKPREHRGAFTVRAPDGRSLKVPLWMTEERAALYDVSPMAAIDVSALLSVADYVANHSDQP